MGPSTEILRSLLERGASVHQRNKAGNTPLWLARSVGKEDHVVLLEETGALLHAEEREGFRKRVGSVDRGVGTMTDGRKVIGE